MLTTLRGMDRSLRRHGKLLLTLVFIGAIVWIVVAKGSEVDWAEVLQSLRRYRPLTIASALGLCLLSYLICSSYDLLAHRYVKHGLPKALTLSIAFVSYAVNMNVGALLGGMGFRLRLYTRYGLRPAQVTQIIGLGVLTNWSGFILVAGLLLFLSPPELPAAWHMGRQALKGAGLLLLAVLATYLLFCALFKGRSRELRGVSFECPSPQYALAQIGLSSLSWLAVSLAVSQLLPDSVPLAAVMAAFMASSLGGLIVRLPAGIGVLEGSFLAVLGGSVGHGRMLAALLAFRAVYYLGPLIAAALGYLALEAMAKQRAIASSAS